MIRIFISFTKVVIAIVVAVTMTSCGFDGVTGNGKVVSKTRDISANFTKVTVDRGLDVVIEQSDVASITVETDENLQDHITTNVENGELHISADSNLMSSETLRVKVRMPIITSVETSGGASLSSANVLKSTGLSVKSNSGSEIDIKVEADKVICESSSGSQITIAGKALTLDSSSSSGSEIDAARLFVNDVTTQSSSGSSIDVHPIVSLDAKASSGSSVSYHSIPKSLKKEENSGGSVSQQ